MRVITALDSLLLAFRHRGFLLLLLFLPLGCGVSTVEKINWAYGPIIFSISTSGQISISGQARWATPIGIFSIGEEVAKKLVAKDDELILVLRHNENQELVESAYKVMTDADVFVVVDGLTKFHIRGRTITLDASAGAIREVDLTGASPVVGIPVPAPLPSQRAETTPPGHEDRGGTFNSKYVGRWQGIVTQPSYNAKPRMQMVITIRPGIPGGIVGSYEFPEKDLPCPGGDLMLVQENSNELRAKTISAQPRPSVSGFCIDFEMRLTVDEHGTKVAFEGYSSGTLLNYGDLVRE